MMSISVVKLTPDEWERHKAIRLRALADSPSAFGSVLEDAVLLTDDDWKQRLARADSATFVATSGSAGDVGLIFGAPYGDHAGLFSMWVAPEARKQGVGGKLVDAVIAWAREANYSQLVLDVGDANTAAITLYAGFLAPLRPPFVL